MIALGIDVGGSSIKGALVDCTTGKLTTDRYRIEVAPNPKPQEVLKIVKQIVEHFQWKEAVGIGFPAVVKNNIVCTASNIDKSWVGVDIKKALAKIIPNACSFLNDADAAGIAELHFGNVKQTNGNVILITVGTGIGTAVFAEGSLLANTELGHICLNGKNAERYISDRTRKRKKLSWKQWAKRFNKYLNELEFLLSPEIIIIGGGISNKIEKFKKHITLNTPYVEAKHLNNAGIIGSAYFAASKPIE